MKNILYYLTAVIVMITIVITNSCKRENDNNPIGEPKQMTLTLTDPYIVAIEMSGSDTVTIDWGDNSVIEKHQFSTDYSEFEHRYYSVSSCTITITGKNIEGLVCAKIQLSDLDVSENTKLLSLYCDHNLLTEIDVSKNTKLESLSCNHNLLTSLDVSKNTKLTTLWCHENLLENLDVTKNIALTKLLCGHNRLAILDMSKNLLLRELYCNNNYLTDLNANSNIALRELNCNGNQLTNIELTGKNALIKMDCRNNRLEKLDMTNNNVLSELYCGFNRMDANSLDKLFITLHNNIISDGKTIYIYDNPGIYYCNTELAEQRGWQVE